MAKNYKAVSSEDSPNNRSTSGHLVITRATGNGSMNGTCMLLSIGVVGGRACMSTCSRENIREYLRAPCNNKRNWGGRYERQKYIVIHKDLSLVGIATAKGTRVSGKYRGISSESSNEASDLPE